MGNSTLRFLQTGSDALALFFAFALGRLARYWWVGRPDGLFEFDSAAQLFAASSGAAILWFSMARGHYMRRIPIWDEAREVISVMIGAAAFHAVTLLVTKQYSPASEYLAAWFAAPFFVLGVRFLLRRGLLAAGKWQRRTAIVGAGTNARAAYMALASEPLLGFAIEVFFELGSDPPNGTLHLGNATIPVKPLASPTDLDEFLGHQVVVAMDANAAELQQEWVQRLTLSGHRDIFVVPNLVGMPLYGMEVTHFFSHDVLLLRARNNLARRGARVTKRVFDIIVSALGLLLLAPLFVVIALAIRWTGPTVLFGHRRVGYNRCYFNCFKFRTMVADAAAALARLLETDAASRQEWNQHFKLKNDPRVTSIGAFLRRTSLDELPQLWNVLRGDMSLVGPRPILDEELERYGAAQTYYLQVRPGITGIWQISGRNDADYTARVALDAWYVRNWSLWYDIAILFRTISVVLSRRGAY